MTNSQVCGMICLHMQRSLFCREICFKTEPIFFSKLESWVLSESSRLR